tara:strand:- start:980 stop:1246 length:267 start_codon:yes stop_codon:yes gene_type:complete
MFSSIGFARLRVVLFLARASTREEQSLPRSAVTHSPVFIFLPREGVCLNTCPSFFIRVQFLASNESTFFIQKKDHIAHRVTSSSLSAM